MIRTRASSFSVSGRDGNRWRPIMFRITLPQRQNLIGRDNDMTVQSARVEVQIHFSIERPHEISLDDHAAEPFPASNLDLWSSLFSPIKLNGVVVAFVALAPSNGHAATRYREGSELRCVNCEFMKSKAEILGCFGL